MYRPPSRRVCPVAVSYPMRLSVQSSVRSLSAICPADTAPSSPSAFSACPFVSSSSSFCPSARIVRTVVVRPLSVRYVRPSIHRPISVAQHTIVTQQSKYERSASISQAEQALRAEQLATSITLAIFEPPRTSLTPRTLTDFLENVCSRTDNWPKANETKQIARLEEDTYREVFQ